MHCTIQRQLTVALENSPGRLATIGFLFAKQGVNIEGITVIDNVEQGVIRLVTSDPALGKTLLVKEGLYVIEADILSVELTDNPGQLALLSQALAEAQINIDYAYGSSVHVGDKMRLMVKVSDLSKACQVLAGLKES